MKFFSQIVLLLPSPGRALSLLGLALWTTAPSAQAAKDSLGVNFGHDTMFADVARFARPEWTPAKDLNGKALTLDAQGWPTQDAALLIWEGVKNNQGAYAVQFQGQAKLEASFGYATFKNQKYDPATNTTTVSMVVSDPGEQNFSLIFHDTKRNASSEKNTGITDLKIMRPIERGSAKSYPASELFTDQVKTLVQKFSVARFLDLTRANNSKETNWSDRNLPSTRRQDPLCWEYVVQFANESGRDVYINIPHGANDDYILKLAQVFRYGSDGVNPYTSVQKNPVHPPLDPSRKVYIEWSNETWNPFFTQFPSIEKIIRAGIKEPNPEFKQLNFDNLPTPGPDDQGRYLNQYTLMHRYHGKRTVETSNIWRSVFGDAAMGERIRVVLEWQYEDSNGTASETLTYINNYYNNGDGQKHVSDPHPVNYFIWGGGGATYFGANKTDAETVDETFASGVPESGYASRMNNTYAWAKAFGLKAVSYEGGWALEKPNGNGFLNPAGSAQAEAKYDPRAKEAVLKAHRDFEEAGGDLNIYYTATGARNYVWGMTDDIYNLNTPIYQAIDTIAAAPRAKTTAGTTVPADLPAGAYVKSEQPTSTDVRFVRSGWKQVYLIQAPSAGAYTLKINYDTGSKNNPISIILNGREVGENLDLQDEGGGWGANVDSPAIPLNLNAGLNAFLFTLKSGDVGLHHFKITKDGGN